jgi:hypothetical protein
MCWDIHWGGEVVNSEAGGRHAHHRTNAFHISAVLKLTAEMHLASFFFFFPFYSVKVRLL